MTTSAVGSIPKPTNSTVQAQSNPVEIAQLHAHQASERLKHISRDPNFNGYTDLVGLASQKGGLVETFKRYQKKGPAALKSVNTAAENTDKSLLSDDYAAIRTALRKPILGAPVDIPDSGLITIPNAKPFSQVLEALQVTPLIAVRTSDLSTRRRGYSLTLRTGRKVALDAPTVDLYLAGISLQQTAIPGLIELIKSGKLTESELWETISSLQELMGSDQEMQQILDTEYLIASRQLEVKKLPPDILNREQVGLAARFLKMRPYFADSHPPVGGFTFQDEVPELDGCEFSGQQPDYLVALGQSRLAATALAATELVAALELRKKQTGSYPATIESLTPGILSRIPQDRFSPGGTFVYTKTQKGYQLASVSAALPGAKNGQIMW